MSATPFRAAALLFALSAPAVVLVWAWLGAPIAMPPSPLRPGTKLDCMSYTPYQANQSPFDLTAAVISPALIDADVARLAPLTDCLRLYSAAGHGIEEVARAAGRRGLSVLQGIWISRDPIANAREIAAALAIAEANPKTVTALIAGNEVLLRQEQTAAALVQIIADVKAKSGLPVTYADVWEFWLKNPAVAGAVDFITIHILPFWEDEPVAAEDAAAHVAAVYARMSAAFPDKRIIIGEVGWPSMGRMRQAARPSPASQARAFHDVVAMTRAKGITANIIEAFDQPWKRALEGTVGGHWGLFDANSRAQKFSWGEPVSDYPHWQRQAVASLVLLALALLVCASATRKRLATRRALAPAGWASIGAAVALAATLAPLSIEPLAGSAFGLSGTLQSLVLAAIAIAAPFVPAGLAAGVSVPRFAQLIGPPALRVKCPVSRALGFAFMVTFLTATLVALGLVFDPRYRELPFAVFGAAAVTLATLLWHSPPPVAGAPVLAERIGGLVLAASALVIAAKEGPANWQALALSASLLLLAFTLINRGGTGAPAARMSE